MMRRIIGCRIRRREAKINIRVAMKSENLSNDFAATTQTGARIGIDTRAIEVNLHSHSSVTVGIENDHVIKCNPPKTKANRNNNVIDRA